MKTLTTCTLTLLLMILNVSGLIAQESSIQEKTGLAPCDRVIRIDDHRQYPQHQSETSCDLEVTRESLMAAGNASDNDAVILAWDGQGVPGQGILKLDADWIPAMVTASGSVVFGSRISATDRNQAIFMADESGLHPRVFGSGVSWTYPGGEGFGDPTPIGGTFSNFGFTLLDHFAPSVNVDGDIFFISQVHEGSAEYGQFLYRAATSDVVKITAVGDTVPSGQTCSALGSGTVNDSGEVLFLVEEGDHIANVYMWDDGNITKVVAEGDPVQGGGTIEGLNIIWAGFPTGGHMPCGPLPSANENGQVAFSADVDGGGADRGLFVSSGGVHEWYLKSGDPTPMGGYYTEFYTPTLNNAGQIAVLAKYSNGTSVSQAWIVGKPGAWRKAIALDDEVAGGTCKAFAEFSQTTFKALDDKGNLTVWCEIDLPGIGLKDHQLVSAPDDEIIVLARESDPLPFGPSYAKFTGLYPLPSKNNVGGGALSATMSGIANCDSAHFHITSAMPLAPDHFTLSETGGTIELLLDARTTNANRKYIILGSASGKDPGHPLPGGNETLPLNWDIFTDLVIGLINSPVFSNFLNVLDNTGQATAQFNAPALPPGYVGTRLYFAYCCNNPFDYVSNPVRVLIVE